MVCPAHAISINEHKAVISSRRCFSCGHCAAICPADAISSDDGGFLLATLDGTPAERLLKGKRSVREFLPTPVSREVIEQLIYFAEKAPSSQNIRHRRYFVISGEEKVTGAERAVVSHLVRMSRLMNPVVRAMLRIFSKRTADLLGALSRKFAWMGDELKKGGHPVFCGAPVVICIACPRANHQAKDDGVCAQQYMMLYAESIGIGSCINGYAQFSRRALETHLDVLRKYRIEAVVMLGYPKVRYDKEICYPSPDILFV